MNIATILKWIVANRNKLFKAILSASVGLLLVWGITLNNKNKKLSEALKIAQNNIEAYQGLVSGSQQANNVLVLTVDQLRNNNDVILHQLDSVRNQLKIKPKELVRVETQTQTIYVNQQKEVQGDLIEILKDTVYSDTIKFNPLTTVGYTIGKDTVGINLDIQNTQYLYVYTKKEYKRKKPFILRLLTLDFKKVAKTKYEIKNTNDLIQTDDVRIIEIAK